MSLTYGFALNNIDNSAQFSEAFRSVVGDGVCVITEAGLS